MLGHLKFVLRQQWRTVSHEQLRVGEVHMPLHYVRLFRHRVVKYAQTDVELTSRRYRTG
ncbi:MAG: hypothetical protein WCD63_15640 [Terrimicrobiaceae bacterium]